MNQQKQSNRVWVLPLLGVLAILLVLAMLRLGIWQLGRAEEKQIILDEHTNRSGLAAVTLSELREEPAKIRFRKVSLRGQFLPEKTVLIDRQVVNGRVGYQVYTPFADISSGRTVLVARGWISAGASRQDLPEIETPAGIVSLTGRLNIPPPKPPLWDDQFPVFDGPVWQFLPIEQYAAQMQIKLFPLVVELAPATQPPAALLIDWPPINDQWVAKHRGYAFQWFAMALAFFIACLILLIRRLARTGA